MKIFLTGDNHIGLKYASHNEAAILCEKRIAAFQSMVDCANKENCALFVIAGDMFENTYSVSKRDIKTLLDTLSRFMGTVVVLPGNHDYYDAEVKVWQYFKDVMQSHDNIMLLTEYRPYELTCDDDDVVLYPALCTSLHSAPGQNNLDWIKDEDIDANGAYHIGIAHGAVEGETIDNEGAYFLMKRSELERIPVDVWLIGHTHVPFPRDLREDVYTVGERIFNAGTHVQTDVSCNTEGQCFIIEIEKDKKLRKKLEGYVRCDEAKIPEGVVEAFIEKIWVSKDEFRWYLRSGSKDERKDSERVKIAEFTINLDQAKAYQYGFSTRKRIYNWVDLNVSIWI